MREPFSQAAPQLAKRPIHQQSLAAPRQVARHDQAPPKEWAELVFSRDRVGNTGDERSLALWFRAFSRLPPPIIRIRCQCPLPAHAKE